MFNFETLGKGRKFAAQVIEQHTAINVMCLCARLQKEVEQVSAAEIKFVPPANLEEFVKHQKKGKKKKGKLQVTESGHESNPPGKDDFLLFVDA